MIGFFHSSEVQKEKPKAGMIPRCGACGLYRQCKSPKMAPYGDGRSGVLVVGEAPGKVEDQQGRPFVGKAGQFLRGTLSRLGVRLDRDAWTTNALICRPPNNATPDAKQIGYCRPNIINAIRSHSPNVVVTLGRSALASVLADKWGSVSQLDRWVGWVMPCEDYWICPTYHPSYLLRMNNGLVDRLFERHLETAFSIEESPPKQPDFARRIELLYEESAIRNALRDIDRQGGWVAVDYETNCLKPEYPEAAIYSFAVSNGKRTVSFPWSGGLVAESVKKFLKSSRTKKIASNIKMEERWSLKFLQTAVANWGWDTMLAAHCLDNRPGICSLKFQALVKLGVPAYNENIEPYLETGKKRYNRIGEIETSSLLFYGGMDAILEWKLARIQRKEMGYD